MRKHMLLTFLAAVLSVSGLALAQTAPGQSAPAKAARLTFEVATVRPAAALDMMKLAQEVQQGHAPRLGAHVDAGRAEYRYLSLRELMVLAYKVQPNQISGPDWLASQRYDIVAKMPEGATKEQANEMLQALLEERFKMTLHRETKELPVFALLVAKDGPNLKESPAEPAESFDPSAPLKPGETQIDGAEGPIRMTAGSDGSTTVNMGSRGTMRTRLDRSTMSLHLEASKVTMAGFAAMLTQFAQAGSPGARPVVDMTELKGNYQVALDFSLSDLMAMARSVMPDLPGVAAAPPTAGDPAAAASEPGGVSSIFAAVKALGLKLEPRKAPIDLLVIDHVEKTPIEN